MGKMCELTFEKICKELRRVIHTSGIPRMRSRFGTSDVIQECGIQIWKKISQSGQSLNEINSSFIRQVAMGHLCRLHRHNLASKRSIKHEASQTEQYGVPCADSKYKHEHAMAMVEGLQSLTATQQEIITRRFFEEETFETISHELKLTVHQVRKQCAVSLQALQRYVESCY